MTQLNTKNQGNIQAAKKRGYTVVPNGVLPEGKKISARAWGIYVYLLSRPDGWKIHAKQLSNVFSEGVGAIYTALQNLVDAGLMKKVDYYEGGLKRQRYEQIAPEVIQGSPDSDSRDLGNRGLEKRDLENRRVTTTELTNTQKITTDNNHSASFVGGELQALSKLGPDTFPQGYSQAEWEADIAEVGRWGS